MRDFPGRMGAGAGAGDFTGEARFGAEWLLRMWDDRTRTLYYQVGHRHGNDDTIGDHDIWRLPQDDDTYGGTRSAVPLHPQPPRVPGGAGGIADQPQPGRPRRRRARALLPGVPPQRTRPSPAAACAPPEHIFALADTHPKGGC